MQPRSAAAIKTNAARLMKIYGPVYILFYLGMCIRRTQFLLQNNKECQMSNCLSEIPSPILVTIDDKNTYFYRK